VEGLNLYFKKYVDTDLSRNNLAQFDPEVMEFGNYTGIDMSAEARRKSITSGDMTGPSPMP
jgi:hypothetical protein